MSGQSNDTYRCLFNPESIVVVGASSDALKPGGRVFKNIKESGYKGHLWAVNPNTPAIMDHPAYPTIGDLPGAPDLALVAIPAAFVRPSLEDLSSKGTGATMILTAGFGEKDEQGKEEENRFLKIAERTGMALIGPNCSGFLTPAYAGKFAGIIPKVRKGAVDIVSGSGATVDYLMEQAVTRGMTFSNVVNMGNSIQMGVEDILALLDENHGEGSAKIILIYMELVKKPQKLLQHCRSLTQKGCTLVGIKSGVTAAGERAAASHTGAMATPDTAVQALFDKAGIIRVRSKMELIDVACALTACRGPLRGNRACVVTDAGGPGVMLSDELNRQGLELPPLGENTRRRLSELLPPESSTANPVDCLPTRNAEQIRNIFRIIDEEERGNMDVIVANTGNSGLSDNGDIYREITTAMDRYPIPIIPVLSSATTCAELIDRVKEDGKVFFSDEVAVGETLGKLIQRPRLSEPAASISGYQRGRIEKLLKEAGPLVDPETVRSVLSAAGFNLPFQVEILDGARLTAACKGAGFPLVMKVIGPLHKSDVGGVKIGIRDMEEAKAAWNELMNIEGASGVLVQNMVQGTEVILGVKKEKGFGHLIMFGLGGIYTEALKDVSFALAPLGDKEAMGMIQHIKGLPILKGLRGEQGVSLQRLSDDLMRLGRLVVDFPQIAEIDLNPVKGFGTDLVVVDARMIQDT